MRTNQGDEMTRAADAVGEPAPEGLEPYAGKPRLRVALLLDGFVQPRWLERAVSELIASNAVEIVLLVVNEAPRPAKVPMGRFRSWIRNRNYLLYAAYQRFDRWWFDPPNDPFVRVDLEPMLKDVPRLGVTPRMTKHCDFFEPADIEAIRGYDLDLAIRFGFRILKGDALRIAKHGVWSYHHGDNLVNRGGPPGFWEVMEGTDVTGCILQRLTENLDDGQVLYRAFASTNKFSVSKNQVGLYWTSSLVLRRVVEDLHRHGFEFLLRPRDGTGGWRGYSNQLYVAPKNGQMAALMLRLARRYFTAKMTQVFAIEQWIVAYGIRRETPAERFVPDTTYYRFRQLVPPPDRFWADPFPLEHEGRRYIFVEEYLNSTGLGRIALFEIDKDGTAQGPVTVLERDYHLSYPFVFQWNGAHYMIPETRESGQIELFRAEEFPRSWVFDRVLVPNIFAVDATLIEMNGRWWMFASVAQDAKTPLNELSIFFADSPFGPWTPHQRNPVRSDVRNSRPAGRIFEWKGAFYRPAQDCSARYGHSIVINEIKHLDLDSFVETEVSRITPGWTKNLLATHTINADGGLTVIDGLLLRRRRRFL
jgi:hypothetical protein